MLGSIKYTYTRFIVLVLALLGFFSVPDSILASTATDHEVPLEIIFRKEETLRYEITWLGITVGRLTMQIAAGAEPDREFVIRVSARAANVFAVFHPGEDTFETLVDAATGLPKQFIYNRDEGKKKKSETYDQDNFIVTSALNDEKPGIFKLDGPVHNEFSSFFFLRSHSLAVDRNFIVPTFADKKRHEVQVEVQKQEKMKSIFGEVPVIRVKPHLGFSGLYQKTGDPVIWFIDDELHVPVMIKASIILGSLVGTLVDYQGDDTRRLERLRP